MLLIKEELFLYRREEIIARYSVQVTLQLRAWFNNHHPGERFSAIQQFAILLLPEDFIVSTEYISGIYAALRNQPLLLIVLNIAVRYPLIYHVRNA
ncbi:MAG: hypothetical protein ABS69_12930 [Nitrosomonadales bacterium SCN 54-20]|nr:MAG: hypothetical protein ABS69_12930 [Nitrosomonadales bacterium SCN 54-20]